MRLLALLRARWLPLLLLRWVHIHVRARIRTVQRDLDRHMSQPEGWQRLLDLVQRLLRGFFVRPVLLQPQRA